MPGLKLGAGLRGILVGACAIAWISAARPVIAQSLNDVCRIDREQTCTVSPAPVGSTCSCFTPSGRVTGRVDRPTGSGGGAKEGPQMSSVCRTARGLCRAKTTGKVGEACECYGDAGSLIAVPSSK